jgi:hypothetical protein
LRSSVAWWANTPPGRNELDAAFAEFGEFENAKRFGDRKEIIYFAHERARDVTQLCMAGIGRHRQHSEKALSLVDGGPRQRLGQDAKQREQNHLRTAALGCQGSTGENADQ